MASRPSTDSAGSSRVFSHGRGGRGNLGAEEGDYISTDSMGVPQLKQDYYTTGRGGNANMMRNVNADLTRMAQDVDNEAPRPSSADFYGGRGGAGNRYGVTDAEREAARLLEEEERRRKQQEKLPPVDHSKVDYRGWADKGKDLLFGRRK